MAKEIPNAKSMRCSKDRLISVVDGAYAKVDKTEMSCYVEGERNKIDADYVTLISPAVASFDNRSDTTTFTWDKATNCKISKSSTLGRQREETAIDCFPYL